MIAFFDLPYASRINNTIAVVRELTRQGEEVDYYSFESFREYADSAGARLCPMTPLPPSQGDASLQRRAMEYSLHLMPELREQIQKRRPELVIFTGKCLWGALVADLFDLPTACLHTNFLLPRNYLPPVRLLRAAYPAGERLQQLRILRGNLRLFQRLSRAYPLRRISLRDLFKLQPNCMNLRGDLNLVYTSDELQSDRDAFDDSYHFTGPCYDKRELDPELPIANAPGQPVVLIALGSMKVYNARLAFYRSCVEAFRDSGHYVIMAIGDGIEVEALGPLPTNLIVRSYVPQLELLARTDVFVTHGGTNSVYEALLNHVPMVVSPVGGDSFLMANRIEELGAGVWVKEEIPPSELRRLVDRVLGDKSLRANATRLGQGLAAAGGTERVVRTLLDFKRSRTGAGRHQPGLAES